MLFSRLPIRFKISIIMILVLSTSIILISKILFDKEKVILLEETKKRGNLLSKNLASAGFETIINKDKLISSSVISEIMEDKSIVYGMILDNKNRVIDSSIPETINRRLKDEHSKKLSKLREMDYFHIVHNNRSVLDVMRPIFIEYKGKKIKKGYVRIGMDWDLLQAEIEEAMIYTYALAIIFLVIGVIISIFFARSITNPILEIVKVMDKVGKGDLSQKVEISLRDEIGKLANAFNTMIQHLREKLMMSKYVSKSTIKMISDKDDTKLELGGKRKKVTLFFSDIRGFTSYSETRTPEQVISMLNEYLRVQAEIIDKNRGSIDKFVGDEIVAVYEDKNMVENAIKTAIEIQRKIKGLSKEAKGKIAIGIGINTGEVVMGNMGSADRMDYTVIGDNVNTAARLCDNAEPAQILVSEKTYRLAKGKFGFEKPITVKVKGKKELLNVYPVSY